MAINFNYSKQLGRQSIHERLVHANEQLIFKYPYYADILMCTNFFETNQVPTMGVNVSVKGFNFYYNPKFVKDLPSDGSVMFIIIHEIFHLLFSHPARTKNGGYDPQMSNIAQDMIINTIINRDIGGVEDIEFIEVPYDVIQIGKDGKPTEYDLEDYKARVKEAAESDEAVDMSSIKPVQIKGVKTENRNNCLFIPKEYKGQPVFEELYEWLKEEKEKRKEENDKKQKQEQQDGDEQESENGQPQQGQGQPQQGGQGKPQQGQGQGKTSEDERPEGQAPSNDYGEKGQNKEECYGLSDMLDNLIEGDKAKNQVPMKMDEHMDDDVPQEVRDQMVKDQIERIRQRGYNQGNFEDIIGKLRKSKKDYLREIKKSITALKGTHKSRTWSKLNRKNLPIKGIRRNANILNLIIDTSGSMHGYFEKALSYVFQNNICINLLQCDTQVYDLGMLKSKKELQKMKVHGLGGTEIQPAFDVVREKYNKHNTVLLTDGYTDNLNLEGIKGKVLILTVDAECPIAHDNGKLKQIIIEDS